MKKRFVEVSMIYLLCVGFATDRSLGVLAEHAVLVASLGALKGTKG